MNKSLADFAQNPLEYDISEMMGEDEITDIGLSGGDAAERAVRSLRP